MTETNWQARMSARARAQALDPACTVFYFLRHGETDANLNRIVQGDRDWPLNATGHQQALAAAPILAALPIPKIAASDLTRVQQTIAPLKERTDLPDAHDRRLRERSFGGLQDQPVPPDLWAVEDDVEPLEAFVDRVVEGARTHLTADHVLIAAHGGVLRAVALALAVDLAPWAHHNALPIEFARVPDRTWGATVLGATATYPAHLDLPDGVAAHHLTAALDPSAG